MDGYRLKMDWLVSETVVFGVTVENWMLAMGCGLLLYISVLAIARRRRPHAR